MIISIDWDFISDLEGKLVLHGYVPQHDGEVIGRSGVTISTGFDIGQYSQTELEKMFFKECPELLYKFTIYSGLTGNAAVAMLKKHPLEITEEEAKLIDVKVKSAIMRQLMVSWTKHTVLKFSELPPQVQTVVCSLAFNFGGNFPECLPKTFRCVVDCGRNGNWRNFFNLLDTFPSKNKELNSRRKKEAALILSIPGTASPFVE